MASFEYSDEQQALIQTAREFTKKEIIPVAGHLDETGTFPKEICEKAWETGLMNCEIPEAAGGLGLSCLSHCLMLEEISYGCTGVNTTMAGNALGSMPIVLAGTEEQKKTYFGRLLAEPIFAAVDALPEGPKRVLVLSPAGQNVAVAVNKFQTPSNRNAQVHPMAPKPSEVKLIKLDLDKYGSKQGRERLLSRWENEVFKAPK